VRVIKGTIGGLGTLWIVALWIIERFGFVNDASELAKGIRSLQVSPNWLAYVLLLSCLAVLTDAFAPELVSVPLRKLGQRLRVSPSIPANAAPPVDTTDQASRARTINALHFAKRCDKHRYDDGTVVLALKIAGTKEGFPVREKMIDVLCGAKPSQDAIEAFAMFYGQDAPSDLTMLRRATRSVGALESPLGAAS
jgi:hypothetical protein